MCLLIKSDQEQNEKDLNKWFKSHRKWFGVHKDFAFVYKVLDKWPHENFYRSIFYRYFIWNFKEQQIFQVDRPSVSTKEELENREIEIGLHVYTHSRIMKPYLEKDKIIVKFRVKREDIVAIENNSNIKKDNFKELVCTRLEFVKVVED